MTAPACRLTGRTALEELQSACAVELSRLGVDAQTVGAAADNAGRWSLRVVVSGRRFHFGTLGGGSFHFIEKKFPCDVDFLRSVQHPDCERGEVLWRHAFTLLGQALADENFRQQAPVVV